MVVEFYIFDPDRSESSISASLPLVPVVVAAEIGSQPPVFKTSLARNWGHPQLCEI
eukprot:SAG31_NODE_16835_length_693_cov_2.353535_1_plen_55_part_10